MEGPADELQITNGSLASDDMQSYEELEDGKLSDSEWDRDLGFGMGLPENNMPVGYKEWPYVWNKSTTSNTYGLSASAFQFEAAGGEPGYTWKIVKGELPMGLELTEDGKIADGLVDGMPDLNSDKGIISIDCPEGDYTFTVQVTDAKGNTAEKEFTIQVKERPNKWFEEGGVSALSHHIVMATWYTDPNFSTDQWAERAKKQGHTLVSVEALQQDYYWPSKFMDPNHYRHQYSPMDENGQIVETLKYFAESVRRYGMQFGLYYATEGGGLQHNSTDVFIQNVSELINRYDPVYLYFDGPQAMPWANFDVMYSAVRNYSDEIIINSNAWGEEYGDPDLGTIEASPHYANPGPSHFVKKVVFEPWHGPSFPPGGGYYWHPRNDYRLMVKEMVTNIGRGYSDNLEQGPGTGRGATWDSAEVMADQYPFMIQRNITVREDLGAWFAPEGLPDRHEATTGTTPYFLSGYGYEDDGKGNYENFAHPGNGIGPAWGYAVSRDNNIYLHIMSGSDGKTGFDAIDGKKLEIGPFEDNVVSVKCLNTNEDVSGFSQSGDRLTIDLSNVAEDPVDTIIKITTDSEEREYRLTDIYLEGRQLTEDSLQIHVEGQLTFPQLKADFEKLTFESGNTDVAAVDSEGIVRPVGNGTTEIKVTGTYEGVTKTNSIQVTARDGKIYVGEELLSAVLKVNGWEAYGELTEGQTGTLELNGRAATGGPIGLTAADITWHTGTIDVTAGDDYVPIVIEENDILTVEDGILTPKDVETKTRAVVWAEVELDGTKVTSNRVFLDLQPFENLALQADVTASENSDDARKAADGIKINGVDADGSRWSASADGESWLEFDFGKKQNISDVGITFNSITQNYINTPKNYDIQISDNGTDWKTVSANSGPSGGAWLNEATALNVDREAQYLRIRFYNGANSGDTVDVVEVEIFGEEALPEYEVTAAQMQNGTVIPDTASAKEGETVTFITAPEAGYQLKESSLKVNGGEVGAVLTEGTANQYTFVMPAGSAEISAEFEPVAEGIYTVAVTKSDNAMVAAEKLAAQSGEEVNLTVYANEGYGLQTLCVDGVDVTAETENGRYTFVMPDHHVAVEVSCVEIRNIAPESAAAADSVYSDGYLPEYAIDYNRSTQWASKGGTEEAYSPSITLEWDEPVLVNKVNLLDRGTEYDRVRGGKLEWGNADGTTGELTVGDLGGESLQDNIYELNAPAVITWMKFTIARDDTVGNERNRGLAEFEVYGIPVSEISEEPEEPEEPSAVRQLLQKTYDRVKDLSTEGVVDSAVKAFEEALANAKDILENRPDAADEEMLEAWNRLVDATHGLGLLKGDKSILEVLVSQAEDMIANADRYVAENWPQLEAALAEAKAVLEDGDAMDDTIRPAEDKLLDAILAQRYKANKDNLQELIDKANAIDLSQYTEESVSVFKAALKTANAVLADENLSQDDQTVVDSAVKELDAAISGLVKTSGGDNTGDGNTGDGGDDGNTGDNGDGNTGSGGDDSNTGAGGSGDSDNGNTGSGDNTGTKDDSSKSDAPKTGDNADVYLWGAVMTAALAGVLAVFATGRRRRKL